MSRRVLVHRCFAAIAPISISTGLSESKRIFHENPNLTCSCRYRVSYHMRNVLLATGEVFIIANLNISGAYVPDWTECVVTARQPRLPKYMGVLPHHILKFVAGDF